MEKLVYDQSQKPILIKSIQAQIDDVKKQLKDLYGFLAQLDVSLVDMAYVPALSPIDPISKNDIKEGLRKTYGHRETGRDYFNKVIEILTLVGKPLTSREILEQLYDLYSNDFDRKDDRKHIATLSSILTEKFGEGKIHREKTPGVGHAAFSLIQNTIDPLDAELDELVKKQENTEKLRMVLERTA